MVRSFWAKLLVVAGLAHLLLPARGIAGSLQLQRASVELPGAPSVVVPADVDHDGRLDLVVVVVYTEWDQIDIEEVSEMQGVEGLVEVLTVIPALTDRRELWVLRSTGDGVYEPLAEPLPLDLTILSLAATADGSQVLLLTDNGASLLQFKQTGAVRSLEIVPWIEMQTILSGSGAFLPDLELLHDMSGDDIDDLLLPTPDGLAVFPGPLGERPADLRSLTPLPAAEGHIGSEVVSFHPLPVIRHVDGDSLPDLVVPDLKRNWMLFHVLQNNGEGRFGRAQEIAAGGESAVEPIVYFGDLDGDHIAEYVTAENLSDDDAGIRKEVRQAKRPPVRYRLYRAGKNLERESEPFEEFEAIGYSFEEGESEFRLPAGFQDLDGDGRLDLVSITLEFSLLKALGILATQRINIGLDFHVWCQTSRGRFEAVEDLDLSGRFRLNLRDLRVGQLSQFAGDFDGDGKVDFVQIGRGREVTIHRGRQGCRFPAEPDLSIRLRDEPKDLSLVQVRDLDGDGRADLMVTQPDGRREMGVTPRARLDLYLSGARP